MRQSNLSTITTVSMVTADRPSSLERSLRSVVGHCEAHHDTPRFIVIDGSRDLSNQTSTRAAVAAVARATGRQVEYIGPAEASLLMTSLAPAPTRFPCVPGAAGTNRNLALLLTAGEHVLFVDDDVLADPWALPDFEHTLTVSGHEDLRAVACFPDRTAAFEAATRIHVSLPRAHSALLGRSLGSLLSASAQPPDLSRACVHLLSGLTEGRSQVIRVTMSGLAGDSAAYCPHLMLLAPGASRRSPWADQTGYALAMSSREVHRIARTYVVTHSSNCMAYCMSVANNTVVPPFMPSGGNEDGVFGLLLSACDPTALFGHLPIGVFHDSGRAPCYTGIPMRSATESRVSELIIAMVRRRFAEGVSGSPGERMRQFGAVLVEAGSMPVDTLERHVSEILRESRHRDLGPAERVAAAPECPEHWRRGFEDYRSELLRNMQNRWFFLPREFGGKSGPASGYPALRAALRGFGELLESWPEIWQGAHDTNAVRRNGVGPGLSGGQ